MRLFLEIMATLRLTTLLDEGEVRSDRCTTVDDRLPLTFIQQYCTEQKRRPHTAMHSRKRNPQGGGAAAAGGEPPAVAIHHLPTTTVRRSHSHHHHHGKQQAPKLLPVVLAVLACIICAAFLFRMDAFHKHHNHKPLNSIPRPNPNNNKALYYSGDADKQQQLRRVPAAKSKQEEEEVDSGNIVVEAEQKEEEHELGAVDKEEQEGVLLDEQNREPEEVEQQAPHPTKRRRVEFTLSNLKDGTENTIVVETVPDWAPLGVAHFWKLLDESQFYDQARFFRVLPKFVAQFGIHADPAVQARYQRDAIPDDPVNGAMTSNTRGTLTFAMSGPNSRTTQLFFNFKDNKYLDREGFAPIGYIVEGMDLLEQIVDVHREKPVQGKIVKRGNEYLNAEFPDLTYISGVREVPVPEDNNVAADAAAAVVR